ncbi:MAG TPA: sugar phosphate nucleotidyltransferase [Chlamydiales bacterium]|nr:sugar phosphate nucleotidyltransferase [Chlamydiales bacterium]
MDAIILAGGFGTRLQKKVPNVPKPLAPINDVPFLDILLKKISAIKQIKKIVLAIGYKADLIVERYKNSGYSFSIEDKPLGTGGALKKSIHYTSSPDLLVFNGDTYVDFSFSGVYEFHKTSGSAVTIIAEEIPNTSRFGTLELDPKTKRILQFKEKLGIPQKGTINCGVYLIKRDLFSENSYPEVFSLENDAFPKLLKKGMYAFPSSGNFIDIGTEESYEEAQWSLTTS